jgi:branched-chain amino acid transport system ATP-binding protein
VGLGLGNFGYFVKIHNEAGVTVLLVEQNVEMALRISHRAYVIDEGRIQFLGTAKELLENEEIQRRYLTV